MHVHQRVWLWLIRKGRGYFSPVLIWRLHHIDIQNTFWLSLSIHCRLNQWLSASAVAETSGQIFCLIWVHENLLALVTLGAFLTSNTVLAFGTYTATTAWLTCVRTNCRSTSNLACVGQWTWFRKLYVRLFRLQSFVCRNERIGHKSLILIKSVTLCWRHVLVLQRILLFCMLRGWGVIWPVTCVGSIQVQDGALSVVFFHALASQSYLILGRDLTWFWWRLIEYHTLLLQIGLLLRFQLACAWNSLKIAIFTFKIIPWTRYETL